MGRRGTWVGLALAALHCGKAPLELPYAPPRADCLSCDTGQDEGDARVLLPSHELVAAPSELMFYADLEAEAAPPQLLKITNDTFQAVQLAELAIVDNDGSVFGSGAAAYFHVHGSADTVALLPGETLGLSVSFTASTTQREALLVVLTSDMSQASLVVPLAGKYFIGDRSF